ncbi:hypothetical protein CLU79DRAFT_741735 [Phycomyces nitens]|nr:hypothetical protein CLU79DRAFT_741735 [Phycomyces nitens]
MYHSNDPAMVFPEITVFEDIFGKETCVSFDDKLYIDCDNPENYFTRNTLKRDILIFAQGLKDVYDFVPGDVMAICGPHHMDWTVAVHGPHVLGAITASVRSGEGDENIVKDIETVKPKLIIAHKETLYAVRMAAKKIGLEDTHILLFGDETIDGIKPLRSVLMSHSTLAVPIKLTPQELRTMPVFLYYTSGTTGTKKAVILTNATMVALFNIKAPLAPPKTRYLSYAKHAHASSLMLGLTLFVKEGHEIYFMNDFSFEALCENVEKYKIQLLVIQPWVAAALAREPSVDKYDISSVDYVFSAGSALDPMTMVRYKERHNAPLVSVYGMTEVLSALRLTPEAIARNSVGILCPGYIAKLVDEEGKEVEHGTIGEICLKGQVITPGYYNNPEATAAAFDEEGFFHCGDLFRVDDDGYFYYMSRRKDMIKYYSYHITPPEIEDVLISHPEVSECCAVGHYSEELSTEIPKAFVVLSYSQTKSVTEEELLEYANDRLPDQMKLRGGVMIIKELPRSALGKVRRDVLRHQLGQPMQINPLQDSLGLSTPAPTPIVK